LDAAYVVGFFLHTRWACAGVRDRLLPRRKSWHDNWDPPRAWRVTWNPRKNAIPVYIIKIL